MTAFCLSCGASIVWATVRDSGRHMPLDAVPDPTGNVAVSRDFSDKLWARVLKAGEQHDEASEKLGISHFAACPQADSHRRRA